MRERSKRTLMTAGAVSFWTIAVVLTVVAARGANPQPWFGFLPITVGAACTATICRYLMRSHHIMAQVYRAGKDYAKEVQDDVITETYMREDIDGDAQGK